LTRRGLSNAIDTISTLGLSQREWDIATAAAQRERNREIAKRLGLSPRTIENHLRNVFRKLGVSSRDELARVLTEPDAP
jgi:DNA-binding NarL/FixJ family response regulator